MSGKSILCFAGLNNYGGEYLKKFMIDNNKIIYPFIHRASIYFKFDILKSFKLALEDSNRKKGLTNFERTIISYICDCTVFFNYRLKRIHIENMVGYSSGLDTALVCGEYLSFEDGLKIISCVEKCFDYAAKNLSQGMATIIGMNRNAIEDLVEKNDFKTLLVCNVSSEQCIMIGGDKEELEKFNIMAIDQGALKINNLDLSFAFHYPKNKVWICKLLLELKEMEIKEGTTKIFSIYSHKILNKEDMTEEIIKNVYTSMNWHQTTGYLEKIGFTEFWDLSLDGKLKKITSLSNKSTFYTFDKL